MDDGIGSARARFRRAVIAADGNWLAWWLRERLRFELPDVEVVGECSPSGTFRTALLTE